jgi:hypothetical protein
MVSVVRAPRITIANRLTLGSATSSVACLTHREARSTPAMHAVLHPQPVARRRPGRRRRLKTHGGRRGSRSRLHPPATASPCDIGDFLQCPAVSAAGSVIRRAPCDGIVRKMAGFVHGRRHALVYFHAGGPQGGGVRGHAVALWPVCYGEQGPPDDIQEMIRAAGGSAALSTGPTPERDAGEGRQAGGPLAGRAEPEPGQPAPSAPLPCPVPCPVALHCRPSAGPSAALIWVGARFSPPCPTQ